ncbi:hypothetical protein [Solobacterium moorei]|uniref:hypothetical protein n=1 Tax=Solobacterium moorei TaxID=102148 RepID=UPI0023EF628B|nr:hypothetical protein [Solobacterium moorei]
MVMLSNDWQVITEATRTPGAAEVVYELQARINSQYHSIELNRDYVEVKVTYTFNKGYIYSGTWNFTATGCEEVSGGGRLDGSGTLISGGFWAYHDKEGNYSTSIDANLSFYFSDADASLEKNIELPNIPRASTPSWKNGKNHVKLDGTDTLTLVLDKKVAAYRHSLVWVVGNSGYKWLNTNDIDTEYVFKPTEEMIKYATDTKSVYGYLWVGTYANGTSNAAQIGTSIIGFYIDLPAEKFAPVINSATVKEIGNSKVPEDKVFRYLSKKKLSMRADVRGYATVKNVYALHNKQQFPLKLTDGVYSVDLEGMNNGDIEFVIEDSRGFKTTQKWQGTYVPYFFPTITEFTAERDNPTVNDGYANAKGTFYNGENNTLTITVNDESGHSVNSTGVLSGNEFTVKQRINGYSYDKNYNLRLKVTDSYGQSTEKSYVLAGNLWAMILAKLTTSVHMLWVRKNGNNPCGIYNEGDTSTLGKTYAKGGLVIGGDDTFLVKRFGAAGARKTFNAAMNDREDVRITVIAPDGYKTIGVIQAYTDYRCSVSLYNFVNGIAYCTVYNSSGWSNTPIGASVDVLFYKCK